MTAPGNGPIEGSVWRTLRHADAPVSVRELMAAAGTCRESVYSRLRHWERAGLVGRQDGRPMRYFAAPGAPDTPPRLSADLRPADPRDGRKRIWTVIRVLKSFTLADLTMAAEVNRTAAQTYVSCLVRAGYVEPTNADRRRAGAQQRYVLIRFTGPRHPRATRAVRDGVLCELVIDPNDGAEHRLGRLASPRANGGEG